MERDSWSCQLFQRVYSGQICYVDMQLWVFKMSEIWWYYLQIRIHNNRWNIFRTSQEKMTDALPTVGFASVRIWKSIQSTNGAMIAWLSGLTLAHLFCCTLPICTNPSSLHRSRTLPSKKLCLHSLKLHSLWTQRIRNLARVRVDAVECCHIWHRRP